MCVFLSYFGVCRISYIGELSSNQYVTAPSSIRPFFYRRKWSRYTSVNSSALRSVSITETSSLLWPRLTSHDSLLLRLIDAHETSRDKSYIFPRLHSWFTHIGYDYLLDFNVLSHLVRYIRLRITFLFVVPRFRYPFLSPLPHDSQAWESLLGSPVAGAHGGLSPQMFDMPIVHTKERTKVVL